MSNNFAVQVAENGNAAIQAVKKKQPDLILLDINMPGISGYEVCKILKQDQTTADTPIIFLTAYCETENIVEGFKLGAVDYVTKPFKTEELLSRVNTHIELKNAKTALEIKNIELQKLNATKDKLFSIISHDLRGPIGSMMTYIDVISKRGPLPPEAMQRFIDLQKNLTHSTYNLLDNLLNWAKINLNQIQVQSKFVNLNNVIDENVALLNVNASKKLIEISCELSKTYHVYADENLLNLIFRNLLNNAIKFTPENGTLSIKLSENSDNIEVKISDSGVGIDKENIFKILSETEFYTTYGTNNEKGTGLGLKLVKNAIELCRGSLNIESELNRGSCFTFTLPINE